MGNRGSVARPGAKAAPTATQQENALMFAHRSDELRQRRKLNGSRGIRVNASTGSLPDLATYMDEASESGMGGMPVDAEQLRDLLVSMGVQFAEDGSQRTREVINNESVIKVFATMQEPDWTLPWQTLDVSDARGSAVVIEGGLILTAAHVIAQWTFIEVQKSSDAKKVPARVVHVCHDADLALLEPIGHKDFLNGITPIKIGAMPQRHDRIFVAGYPIGGEELSVTEGVVSRIEVQPYSHSLRQLLAVTVDAAINSGNSGGPVFNAKGELAGIAFQAMEGAENVGHIIPPPIINHFLNGVARDGKGYKGFPELGIMVQNLENPALRKHLKMKDEHTGVLIVKLSYGCSGFNVLKENDVMLNIDGYAVANNGTIEFEDGVRGEYQLAIHKHFVGDKIPIKVWREGAEVDVTVELVQTTELVPLSQYIHNPPFFVYAGLLFQPLSTDLLRNYFAGGMMISAPQELLYLATSSPTKTRHEVVVLTRVFRDEINIGYEDLAFSVINTVGGKEVEDLKHFISLIEGAKPEELIKIITSQNASLILPAPGSAEMQESKGRIASRYNLTVDRHVPEEETATKKKSKRRKSVENADDAPAAAASPAK